MATVEERKELANALLIIANLKEIPLKPVQRRRLNLMADEGLGTKAIAAAEGVSLRAVERSLQDAQEKIKKTLPLSLR